MPLQGVDAADLRQMNFGKWYAIKRLAQRGSVEVRSPSHGRWPIS